MPKKRANTMAMAQHVAYGMGYPYLLGVELTLGNMRKDMGGRLSHPAFRADGAPVMVYPNGAYDLLLGDPDGNLLAIQATSRSALASRVAKLSTHSSLSYVATIADLRVWGFETIPQTDGSYRYREMKLDDVTGEWLDSVQVYVPTTCQQELLAG